MNKNTDRQLSLDGLFYPPPPPVADAAGALDLGLRVRNTLKQLLKDARAGQAGGVGHRDAIAEAISFLTGRPVSKNMLDRYAAPSASEWRFPLEILPALIKATGDFRLLHMIAEACGARVLIGEEVIDAEIGRVQRSIEQLKRREAELKRVRGDKR